MLVDTGILYAAADAADSWHGRASELLRSTRDDLLIPSPVLAESCKLLERRLGVRAVRALISEIQSRRFFLIEPTPADLDRIVELIERYEDARLGFVDASVIAVAERLAITKIATTDRRDFSLVKPAHCERFDLLP